MRAAAVPKCKWCHEPFKVKFELAKHMKTCAARNVGGQPPSAAQLAQSQHQARVFAEMGIQQPARPQNQRLAASQHVGQPEEEKKEIHWPSNQNNVDMIEEKKASEEHETPGELKQEKIIKEAQRKREKYLDEFEQKSHTRPEQYREYFDAIKGVNGDVPQNYLCVLCKKFVLDPVICQTCEITVSCDLCYKNYVEVGVDYCPRDGCQAINPPIPAPKLMMTMINTFMTRCDKLNCPSNNKDMSVGQYRSHIKQCCEQAILCTLGCGTKLTNVKEADQHYDDCPLLQINCGQCHEPILRKDMEQHIEYCNTQFINCELCSERMRKDTLDKHMSTTCPEQLVNCLRCNMVIKRKLQGEHGCKNELAAQLKEQRTKLQELESQLSQLRHDEHELNEKMAFKRRQK